jgi:hypothetical protein
MLKEKITAQDACNMLNELLKLDYECTAALIRHHECCNKSVTEHPTIQVQCYGKDKHPLLGIVGVINGMFGIREDGMGAICYESDENDKILGFKITPPAEDIKSNEV